MQVPLITLHDQVSADPLSSETPLYRQINLVEVQEAVDRLMDHNQEVYVETVRAVGEGRGRGGGL